MVMISYNEAIDPDIMEVLKGCGLKNYTKVAAAYGKGTTSGTHLGNDIWPGLNSVLFIACEDKQANNLISAVKQLRQKFGYEGAKAFLMPIEELT